MTMIDELYRVLLNNGPMGLVAAVFFYMYWQERKDHAETRRALVDTVGKYEELVRSAIEAMTKVTTLISERIPNRNYTTKEG